VKDFEGKVAVVTGAASGIGRALAERFAVEKMKVVVADIEEEPLRRAASEMEALGADVVAVRTDVSRAEDVEALARTAEEAFGAVHVLCNNAGVGGRLGPLWTQSRSDWDWVLGVNLWGVIHGVRAFVPRMVAHGAEGHVVNTASIAGLISLPNTGVYNVSKHAVVTLSETLHHELALIGSKIKVSVLCPGFVNTKITHSDRNRPPDEAEGEPKAPAETEGEDPWRVGFQQAVAAGLPPELVAHRVLEAIMEDKLYVLTHPELKGAVKRRLAELMEEKNPVFVPWF
jgi:NAD(P)-dependent dehydrogenase (short-subunit alcohol dehydrogenase family)